MTPDYQEYINSKEWKEKATAVKWFYGNKCMLCNRSGVPLHAHHNTYDRLGNERFTDLIPLCETCHTAHHGHDLTEKVKGYIMGGNVDMGQLWGVIRDIHMSDFVNGLEDYETAVRRWIKILGFNDREFIFKMREQ